MVKQIQPTLEGTQLRRKFVIDTDADVATLPSCAAGSAALSVESGSVFVVNASGEWKKFGGGE